MESFSNNFLKKKILVYGLGKSGLSTLKFLQKKSEIYAYDDFNNRIKNLKLIKIRFTLILMSFFHLIKIIVLL